MFKDFFAKCSGTTHKAKKWITSRPILAAFNALHFKSFMDKTLSGFLSKFLSKTVQIGYLALPVAVIHKLLTAALKMHSV